MATTTATGDYQGLGNVSPAVKHLGTAMFIFGGAAGVTAIFVGGFFATTFISNQFLPNAVTNGLVSSSHSIMGMGIAGAAGASGFIVATVGSVVFFMGRHAVRKNIDRDDGADGAPPPPAGDPPQSAGGPPPPAHGAPPPPGGAPTGGPPVPPVGGLNLADQIRAHGGVDNLNHASDSDSEEEEGFKVRPEDVNPGRLRKGAAAGAKPKAAVVNDPANDLRGRLKGQAGVARENNVI